MEERKKNLTLGTVQLTGWAKKHTIWNINRWLIAAPPKVNSDVQSFIGTSRNTKQVYLLSESASLIPADRREKANVKKKKKNTQFWRLLSLFESFVDVLPICHQSAAVVGKNTPLFMVTAAHAAAVNINKDVIQLWMIVTLDLYYAGTLTLYENKESKEGYFNSA